MALVKKQDVKYFRMNGQTTHHHYLTQIPDLPKDIPCRKVVNLTLWKPDRHKLIKHSSNKPFARIHSFFSVFDRYDKFCQKISAPWSYNIWPTFVTLFRQTKPVGCTLINLVGDRHDFDRQCTLKSDERQRRKQYEKVKEFHPSDRQF